MKFVLFLALFAASVLAAPQQESILTEMEREIPKDIADKIRTDVCPLFELDDTGVRHLFKRNDPHQGLDFASLPKVQNRSELCLSIFRMFNAISSDMDKVFRVTNNGHRLEFEVKNSVNSAVKLIRIFVQDTVFDGETINVVTFQESKIKLLKTICSLTGGVANYDERSDRLSINGSMRQIGAIAAGLSHLGVVPVINGVAVIGLGMAAPIVNGAAVAVNAAQHKLKNNLKKETDKAITHHVKYIELYSDIDTVEKRCNKAMRDLKVLPFDSGNNRRLANNPFFADMYKSQKCDCFNALKMYKTDNIFTPQISEAHVSDKYTREGCGCIVFEERMKNAKPDSRRLYRRGAGSSKVVLEDDSIDELIPTIEDVSRHLQVSENSIRDDYMKYIDQCVDERFETRKFTPVSLFSPK